jgi:hypothetical protein
MKYLLPLIVFTPLMFGGNSSVWEETMPEHYQNSNNPDLIFHWSMHHIVVPGLGGANASEKAVVQEHHHPMGGPTLVDPHNNHH